MDRSAYIAMTGAAQMMRVQSEVAQNLANADTVGFKAQMSAFTSVPVQGGGLPTRINAVYGSTGWDMSSGNMMTTGRDLDVAVKGDGWIAVQDPQGQEAYTRAGQLKVDQTGLLTDNRGDPVLGDGGPITVPPGSSITVGADGTISTVPLGETPATVASVGRIKLVNPGNDQLELGGDGLFHLKGGGQAPADAQVKLASGMLEGSNVDTTDALVHMIELSRQFEMEVRAIHTADDNDQASSKLLQMG
ncbi:flagellar basal-body rod protein FlgF [Oleiagrimonas sp. C23AA]|uniref:flagellar basal-body rod protein FlgF n=1 Tax=Oleiagrimonas sp. C23AA TaxID=2719047 RepID=UPI0014241534|nr:flagellar basal-body rod protein FlgF [Oleiagrimonas sp. C23AA]NII09210.1 flagellar basal-body rod protein FlgF [Oleiagrimonas sp. C23AA]